MTGGQTVGTAGVSGTGRYHPSAGFTPTARGTYWWYASYGGDTDNGGSNSGCGPGMTSTKVASRAVTGLSPNAGSTTGGNTVTIKGLGFNSSSLVEFNGTTATVTSRSSTQLIATVPKGATSGPISVTNTTSPTGTVNSAASYSVT